MSYAVIQTNNASPTVRPLWAVIELVNDAYVSPAGYVVGQYRMVKDNFKHKIVADTLCKDFNGEL